MPICAPDRAFAGNARTLRRLAARWIAMALASFAVACGPSIDTTTATPAAAPQDGAAIRPASAETFPRLHDIPDRPTDVPTPEDRRQLRTALEADRQAARDLAPEVDQNATGNPLALPTPLR